MFVLVVIVMMVSPGPSVVLAITNGLLHGVKGAIKAILGNVTGVLVMTFIGLMGIGLVLRYSAPIYDTIKWIGGAYLAYMGIKMWRNQSERIGVRHQVDNVAGLTGVQLYRQGLMITMSNPKLITFIVAVFPQFVVIDSPLAPQYLTLVGTLICLQIITLVGYAFVASQVRSWLNGPGRLRLFNRLTGLTFVGFAIEQT